MMNYYWKIDDGRIWSFEDAGWIEEKNLPEQYAVQPLLDDGQPGGLAELRARIRHYGGNLSELAEIEDLRPGPDYDLIDGQWIRRRFSKKDFLLFCGLSKVVALNASINAGNALAKTVHDLLFAAEYIDLSDPATAQMLSLLADEQTGNIFSAEEVAAILKGQAYEPESV